MTSPAPQSPRLGVNNMEPVTLTPAQRETLFKIAVQQTIVLNKKLFQDEKNQGYCAGLEFALKLFDATHHDKEIST